MKLKAFLLSAILTALPSYAGTVTGNMIVPNGLPVKNGVLTFQLQQAGLAIGSGSVVPIAAQCATSSDGSVVGLPNQQTLPNVVPGGFSNLISGIYYVKTTFYNTSGESLPSPEFKIQTTFNQTLIVSPPKSFPLGATGMKVYIGAAPGAETLQGTTTNSTAQYVQSQNLTTGAAPPTVNSSICTIAFNDTIIPYSGYNVSLLSAQGNAYPGWPQAWQLNGGLTGTINVSQGSPLWNGVTIYPAPLLQQPLNHGPQSISGNLSLDGYNLLDVGDIEAQTIGGIPQAQNFPGSDLGAKIINAIATLPPWGGIVDARATTGTISENMAAGLPLGEGVTILLGEGVYVMSGNQSISSSDFVIQGAGQAGGYVYGAQPTSSGTIIQFTQPTGDLITYNQGAFRGGIRNIGFQPFPGITKTSGNIINSAGTYNTFRDIELDDPWQGFFLANGDNNSLEDVYVNTTKGGTLNYGVMIYGTSNDVHLDHVFGLSSFAIGDAFVHLRNRASGVKATKVSWQSNGGGGIGVLLDCGTSPTSTPIACTDHYGPSPTDRPEFVKFSQTFCEANLITPCIEINGGRDVQFDETYVASSLQAVKVTGESNGVVFDKLFALSIMQDCIYDAAFSADGPGYASLTITNSKLDSCSIQTNRTYSGIEVASLATDVTITNNRIGHSASNAAADVLYGVLLDGSNENIIVTGNNFTSLLAGEPYMVAPIQVVGGVNDSMVFANNIPVSTSAYSRILTNNPGYQIFPDGVNTTGDTGSGLSVYRIDANQGIQDVGALASCTITAGAIGNSCTKSVALPVAYNTGDTFYVPVCSIINPSGLVTVGPISSITNTGFVVSIVALSTSATGGGEITCHVIHN